MIINNYEIFEKAQKILKTLLGEGASFREGQYEAIEATMTKKHTLVVQRTGWGKSLVYFTCTKLLRENGEGVTIVVSPLLALMQNQLEAGQGLGLRCEMLNKTTIERHDEILKDIKSNKIDLVLVTPETLFKEEVREELEGAKIGLFVIDEAHCISDWGHDFRIEYSRLREIISHLDKKIPILATTATANNRVIEDLRAQLGADAYISRGPLTRETLSIQVLNMPSRVERYGWILENIGKLDGSGIIYCLTKRDCDYLADFLNKNGVSAMPYYSEKGSEEQNIEAERRFKNNEIKALVATIKLGMGYDKGDIAFVIHYQMPANIVSYYQQIGRAGRSIDNASVFLMYGKEDMTIVNYFIDTIFPSREDAEAIFALIKGAPKGIKARAIEASLNISKRRIERTLEYLENELVIEKVKYAYVATGKELFYDEERYSAIISARRLEARQMYDLATQGECFSKYIVNCIDDHSATPCGRCERCLGRPLLSPEVSLEYKEIASSYINHLSLIIQPRKMWPALDELPSSRIDLPNEEGICLSQYGEVGYGEQVKRCIEQGERITDELVGKSAELLLPLVREKGIMHLAYIPTSNNEQIRDFALRLSKTLGVTLLEPFDKKICPKQAEMENGAHRCANALRAHSLKPNFSLITDTPTPVILLDDTLSSRWTLTVCGHMLREAGASAVYPFVLASTSDQE